MKNEIEKPPSQSNQEKKNDGKQLPISRMKKVITTDPMTLKDNKGISRTILCQQIRPLT